MVWRVWASAARAVQSPSSHFQLPGPATFGLQVAAMCRSGLCESAPHVQSGTGTHSDHAALAHWLGCFLLAWSATLCSALVGATTARRLLDRFGIPWSEDAIEDYLQRYQCMLAARQQDPAPLKKQYQKTRHLLLSIDGLQPEKGHETLYVVRELGQQRVWFAEALLASATDEIRRLIVQARAWAELIRRLRRLRRWKRAQEQVSLGEGYLRTPFVVRNGYIDLPTGPGLGIELDEKLMADKIGHKWRNRETYDEDDGSEPVKKSKPSLAKSQRRQEYPRIHGYLSCCLASLRLCERFFHKLSVVDW